MSDVQNEQGELARLVPDNIRKLKPYQPGKPVEELERELGISGAIKVASNENPLGPSPLALKAIHEAVEQAQLYPDGGCFRLRKALGQKHNLTPEQFVFGAGANELIHMAIHCMCMPGRDQVVSHKYAFISYKLASYAHGVEFVAADVDAELRCDVDALLGSIRDNTRIVFVASPNNPTGAHLRQDELDAIVKGVPDRALLVVDEAYYDYARQNGSDYASAESYVHDGKENLLVLRTFSKIYGLAGFRIGYGMGQASSLSFFERIRRPFNVNSIAQAAALAAMNDEEHITRSAQVAKDSIAIIRSGLGKLGLKVYPSLANFVLVDAGRPGQEVYDQLLGLGVIVRPMGPWGLPTGLRVSVGTQAESNRVVEAFSQVFA